MFSLTHPKSCPGLNPIKDKIPVLGLYLKFTVIKGGLSARKYNLKNRRFVERLKQNQAEAEQNYTKYFKSIKNKGFVFLKLVIKEMEKIIKFHDHNFFKTSNDVASRVKIVKLSNV